MKNKIVIKRKATGQPEQDTPHSVQISAMNEQDQYILSVSVKKTYHIDKNGTCIPSVNSLPLYDDLVFYPDTDDELLEHDADIFAIKPRTDVVIKGYAQKKEPSRQFTVEVQIGKYQTSILAIGDRKAFMNQAGKVQFSQPELIDKIPLRYDYAYGGWDKLGEPILETPSPERIELIPEEIDWMKGSLYRYPRNPMGKGYLVHLHREAVEQLALPNLEDPKDRLKKNKLAAGEPERWVEMPIPRATDWVSHAWFPRYTYFGLPVDPVKIDHKPIEVVRSWAPNDVLLDQPPEKKFSFRCANGASLGLQLPHLKGNETCRLTNVHPEKSNFTFKLPSDIPSIWVDGRNGKLKSTSPKLHSVIIEPEVDRVSLVWAGHALALRPYFEEELRSMPYKVKWK